MNKKLRPLFIALLIAVLTTSNVLAGGNIKLSGSVGSSSPLHLDGTLYGVGGYKQGVTATLTGYGYPVTICTNPGSGIDAPGQNPPKFEASGADIIPGSDINKKNGTSPVFAMVEYPTLTGTQGGCPNDNWTATIVSVDWTNAVVIVINNANNEVLLYQTWTCFPVPNSTAYTCTLDE